jgi:hypothetical protein
MSIKVASIYADATLKDNLTPKLTEMKGGIAGFGTNLKSMAQAGALAIGGLTVAFLAVKKGLDATVGTFVNYAGQVRTISQVTGESAESVSRLLQVTDDYKIDVSALTVVMKKMATEGLSFTTDSLADLSDAYLKLEPGVERQIFLNEKFGRQGVAFAEIMLAGGKAIREKSEAIQSGLILDQRALDQARELEIAQDDLNDSWEALTITVGRKAVPAIADWVSGLNDLLSGEKNLVEAGVAFWSQTDDIAQVVGEYGRELRDELNPAIVDTAEYTDELNYVLGFTPDAFSRAAVAALVAKAAVDGVVTQEEIDFIYDAADALGVMSDSEIEAAKQGWAAQAALLAIADMPDEIKKKFILNIEIFGLEGATRILNGMIPELPTPTPRLPTPIIPQMAGGGKGGVGGWATVGEEGMEWVYGNPGGGFTVYNKSQMSGVSAPPMAGGGQIPPQSSEVNISSQSVRDLADALFYKLQAVL